MINVYLQQSVRTLNTAYLRVECVVLLCKRVCEVNDDEMCHKACGKAMPFYEILLNYLL